MATLAEDLVALEATIERFQAAEVEAEGLSRLAAEADGALIRARWLLGEAVVDHWLARGTVKMTPELHRVLSHGTDGPLFDVLLAQGFAARDPDDDWVPVKLTEAGVAARFGELIDAIRTFEIRGGPSE